jgi:penicillin-binding protein 2
VKNTKPLAVSQSSHDKMAFARNESHATELPSPTAADPRRRLRIIFLAIAAAMLVVLGRAAQLELTQGAAFRAAARRQAEQPARQPPKPRGRILSRDGVVLAEDRELRAVAVNYRWLQEPADAAWLRAAASRGLAKAERRDPQRLAEAEATVLAEREAMCRELARLCGLSWEQWTARRQRIQTRVQRIAESHNRRLQAARAAQRDASWTGRLRRLLFDEPPPRETVAEELDWHVMAEDAPAEAIAAIENNPDRFPGAKILSVRRRTYPQATLAAHLLGHLGPGREDESLVGVAGVERQYEAELRDGDLNLSIDYRLQRAAEEFLSAASGAERGGAIAVMDVRDGALLALASAPAFDPNLFIADRRGELPALLNAPSHPLLNRATQMVLPPGSAFKPLAAVALLETGTVSPQAEFFCKGYLRASDRLRCEMFARQGIGHGRVTLADALAQSCNVYFFHHAERMGGGPLVAWAERFGFGRPSGVDLPGEAPGNLPGMSKEKPITIAEARMMAIGQGELTATPLQMLRMIAAVANGGRLVVPRVREERGERRGEREKSKPKTQEPRPFAAIREGLLRVVSDPRGTAHDAAYIESIAIAGKTGTAEVGGGRPPHAWFVGYAPADEPKAAFVIVLEHGGDAAATAAPIARRLALKMDQLGLLQ